MLSETTSSASKRKVVTKKDLFANKYTDEELVKTSSPEVESIGFFDELNGVMTPK